MDDNRVDNPCSKVWSAIAAREYRNWNGLPVTCTYSLFDTAFARLRDEYGQGGLGSAYRQTMYRMHVAEGYPHNLKVWFREDSIVLIEIGYPVLPYPSHELLRNLGEPEIKLNYYLDVMPIPNGAWVYPDRGLTLFLDAGHTEVMWVALFQSCSAAKYLEEVHPETRVQELPVRE